MWGLEINFKYMAGFISIDSILNIESLKGILGWAWGLIWFFRMKILVSFLIFILIILTKVLLIKKWKILKNI